MGLHKNHQEDSDFSSEMTYDEDPGTLSHKKEVRRLLEARLDRLRLKHELEDELTGEFDWDDLDR